MKVIGQVPAEARHHGAAVVAQHQVVALQLVAQLLRRRHLLLLVPEHALPASDITMSTTKEYTRGPD